MLKTGMKTRLITNAKQKTQNPKSQTELITEFTPSTGLRLRAPLQWEPNQLILKMVQMVLGSANQFSSMGKSLQDLFSGIIQIGFRSKEKPNRTEKTDRLLTITEIRYQQQSL